MEDKGGKPTDFQKEGLGIFSSFIGAVLSWPALLLLYGYWSDSWFGHRSYSVDGLRDHCSLIRMILVEQADELPKVLDRWSWLLSILFFWIAFPGYQIV